MKEGIKLGGRFIIEIYDNKKNMNLISRGECHNIIPTEGCNFALDQMGAGAAQVTALYCLMFEDDKTPNADTTYAVPVFTETQAYNEETRPEYVPAAATGKSMSNTANKAVFTMNASKTLYGAALVGGGTAPTTKGNTDGGGKMLAAGKFGTAQPAISGNVVNLTYTLSSDDDGA